MESYNSSKSNESLEQVNQLIELAEKSSEQKKLYESKLSRIYFLMFVLTLVSAIGVLFLNEFVSNIDFASKRYYSYDSNLIGAIAILMIFIYMAKLILDLLRLRREINSEQQVLYKLLDMIHEFKSYKLDYSTLNSVEKALIEIRLSRINFSSRKGLFR